MLIAPSTIGQHAGRHRSWPALLAVRAVVADVRPAPFPPLSARIVEQCGAHGSAALVRAEPPIGPLTCRVLGDTTAGDKVIITVRPENILLSVGVSDKIGNVVTGEVDHLIYLGNMLDCIVRVCSERIRVQLHPRMPSCVVKK